ncbi:phosphopentomutase [Idiomarina seosinensis]|uniref:phosphopentomutase n=1 Tax=Idiomarina seosinensis TaxID=281739 RepID=UPI00385015AF
MARAIVVVLDSFGIGSAPDAVEFGDSGADTFGHIAEYRAQQGRPLKLPNLTRLGLAAAHRGATGRFAAGFENTRAEYSYAWAAERSSGKDTPSGHWELMGVPVHFDWGYFEQKEDSFPQSLLDELIQQCDLPGVLGNCQASGTEIIEQLGEEHIKTGKPIVYTSADSVFQIAAHEQHFGLPALYQVCETARRLLNDYNIGRVIARPFVGEEAGSFERTHQRRDYAVKPPAATVLDKLTAQGGKVIAIGKIADIFAHQGISQSIKAAGSEALLDATLDAMQNAPEQSLIFTNLVDFDTLYGHRRNIEGYAGELEKVDARLPQLMQAMGPDDLLVLTADHGCDPSWPGSDHTREFVPFLMAGNSFRAGSYGQRDSFADLGQTLCDLFELPPMDEGQSMISGKTV